MARKTIEVAKVKDLINGMLANSTDDHVEGRRALALALESVLLETDNYHGFRYLASEYLPAAEQTYTQVLRDGYDDSRRRYF